MPGKTCDSRLPPLELIVPAGERQKVSLAKALIKNPQVCLLDEPFANLSQEDKDDLIPFIKKNIKDKGITVILVTHDYTEAISLADKIFVMCNSEITFKGTPIELIENKDNELIQYLKMSKENGKQEINK